MARLPTPGGDNGVWGFILNEYLEVEHLSDGTHNSASNTQRGVLYLRRDLGNNSANPYVTGLQGRNLSTTAPTDGQALVWNNALSEWEPQAVGGGGGGQRSVTLVVAASNSSAAGQSDADYVCDGTDDQVEINTALSALANGGTVKLLEGTYNISASITLNDTNQHLTGQGNSSILRIVDGSAAGFSVVYNDGNRYCQVSHLAIEGNRAGVLGTGYRGVHYENDTWYFNVNNLSVENLVGDGVRIERSAGINAYGRVTDCHFLSNDYDIRTIRLIYVIIQGHMSGSCEYSSMVLDQTYNSLVTDNFIETPATAVIDDYSVAAIRITNSSSELLVSNNQIMFGDSTAIGIDTNAGFQVKIVGNFIESMTAGHGIYINSANTNWYEVTNNHVSYCYDGGAIYADTWSGWGLISDNNLIENGEGIYVYGEEITINSNFIWATYGSGLPGADRSAISVPGDAGDTWQININNNFIYQGYSGGIDVYNNTGRATRISIENNMMTEVDQSTTNASIRVQEADYVQINGNLDYDFYSRSIYVHDCTYVQVNGNHSTNGSYNDGTGFSLLEIDNSPETMVHSNYLQLDIDGFGTKPDGITISNNSDRCSVQSNMVRAATNTVRYAINISTADCDNVYVINNDVRNSYATAPINDNGTGTILSDPGHVTYGDNLT